MLSEIVYLHFCNKAFFKIFIFTLFYFTILYWFCHTLTWIHHGCTCVPKQEPLSHLPPHNISLGHPQSFFDWEYEGESVKKASKEVLQKESVETQQNMQKREWSNCDISEVNNVVRRPWFICELYKTEKVEESSVNSKTYGLKTACRSQPGRDSDRVFLLESNFFHISLIWWVLTAKDGVFSKMILLSWSFYSL